MQTAFVDEVFVSIPDPSPAQVTPPLAAQDSSDDRTFMIVGTGAAGYYAV